MPTVKTHKWVVNGPKTDYNLMRHYLIGKPKRTKTKSVKALEEMGICGFYEPVKTDEDDG